jgi:hypothetical protein
VLCPMTSRCTQHSTRHRICHALHVARCCEDKPEQARMLFSMLRCKRRDLQPSSSLWVHPTRDVSPTTQVNAYELRRCIGTVDMRGLLNKKGSQTARVALPLSPHNDRFANIAQPRLPLIIILRLSPPLPPFLQTSRFPPLRRHSDILILPTQPSSYSPIMHSDTPLGFDIHMHTC